MRTCCCLWCRHTVGYTRPSVLRLYIPWHSGICLPTASLPPICSSVRKNFRLVLHLKKGWFLSVLLLWSRRSLYGYFWRVVPSWLSWLTERLRNCRRFANNNRLSWPVIPLIPLFCPLRKMPVKYRFLFVLSLCCIIRRLDRSWTIFLRRVLVRSSMFGSAYVDRLRHHPSRKR